MSSLAQKPSMAHHCLQNEVRHPDHQDTPYHLASNHVSSFSSLHHPISSLCFGQGRHSAYFPPLYAFPGPETSFSGQSHLCESCPSPGDWPKHHCLHPAPGGPRHVGPCPLPAVPRALPLRESSSHSALYFCLPVSVSLSH